MPFSGKYWTFVNMLIPTSVFKWVTGLSGATFEFSWRSLYLDVSGIWYWVISMRVLVRFGLRCTLSHLTSSPINGFGKMCTWKNNVPFRRVLYGISTSKSLKYVKMQRNKTVKIPSKIKSYLEVKKCASLIIHLWPTIVVFCSWALVSS